MSRIKDNLKYLIPASIISFVISFMLYIYEPILTYSSNVNDFWFDFKLMLSNIILYFVVMFLGIIIAYTIILFLNILISKKNGFFKVILLISFTILFFMYIQGNFLVGSLPTLNGETINWDGFNKEKIISAIILLVIMAIEIIMVLKVKFDKTLKINSFVAIGIFFMLLTSFITILIKPDIYQDKTIAVATNKNINNASSDKNLYIFIADSVDSKQFSQVIEESQEYSSTFNDFTYYPDTTSAYLYTKNSIPFIMSSIWNENETEFREYYNYALENSDLIKKLEEQNYDINFYEYQLYCDEKNASRFSNIDLYNNNIDKIKFFKQLTKYDLFKYLPYQLKKYSKIETANFDSCKTDEILEGYDWYDDTIYNMINNNDINIVDNKYCQILHIEGGHVPFDYDENVNKLSEEGTYKQKLKATLNIINSFINRLKNNDVYDNSVIIVLADHGEGQNTLRQNPILYIKGINEHHEMKTSDIPISYVDLKNAYLQLLEDKKSEDLFKGIERERIRRVLYMEEDKIIEYEQKGNAGDDSGFNLTGREFKR